jgi:GAF domain-containing protein
MDDIEGIELELTREVEAVAGVVLSSSTVEGTLRQVVRAAVTTIDGCDSAGVFILDGQAVRTVAHSDELVVELDRQQQQASEGPCLSALADRAVVYVGDLAEDDRYPRFAPAAAESGVRTVLAYPLVTDGLQGALNLYGRVPNAVGATDRAKGAILAVLAGVAVGAASQRQEDQAHNLDLQQALISRELIGQAQGILMERELINADQAFDILRRASQHLNQKLRDVAQSLVDTGESPDTGESSDMGEPARRRPS